jgi:hypothetical protein
LRLKYAAVRSAISPAGSWIMQDLPCLAILKALGIRTVDDLPPPELATTMECITESWIVAALLPVTEKPLLYLLKSSCGRKNSVLGKSCGVLEKRTLARLLRQLITNSVINTSIFMMNILNSFVLLM